VRFEADDDVRLRSALRANLDWNHVPRLASRSPSTVIALPPGAASSFPAERNRCPHSVHGSPPRPPGEGVFASPARRRGPRARRDRSGRPRRAL
jgi:hypothetical protein